MKRLTVKNILLAGIIPILFISCNNAGQTVIDEDKTPIVSVYDKTLYKDQVNQAMPYRLSEKDSLSFIEQYSQKWISEILIYEKATRNIIDNKAIDQLVEDYRRALIIHSYQEDLVRDKFNSNLSTDKLEEFYTANKKQFELKEPIIKGLYLKIPIKSSQLANFRKWYSLGTDDAISNIEKNTLQNAVGYEYFYNKWININEIFATIPKQIEDKNQFLKNNKSIDIQDSSFVYLLHIKEYRLTGEETPFEYVQNEISQILRERNRATYLKQIQQDLYDKAISEKEIKFYKK